MSKIRIFELAEELQLPAETLVEALRDLNLNISNPMSMVDMQVASVIREVIIKQRKKRPFVEKQPVSNPSPTMVAPEAIAPVDALPMPPTGVRVAATTTAAKKPVDNKPGTRQQDNRQRDKRHAEPAANIVNRKLASPGRGHRPGGTSPSAGANVAPSATVTIESAVTVGEFAKLTGRSVGDIITKLMHLGVMATINQHLDFDTLGVLAAELNVKLEIKLPPAPEAEVSLDIDPEESLQHRYPVVTVMGHVDHGKTSLLDCIRRTNVTASEAGGITQHIGAYQVDVGDEKIVFLDTPGHEAFTQMRARGAKVTDIAILVVAADDGVMPQTIEALNHAKAANVPIIVAVNKMDKPNADPSRIKQQLTEYGLVTEEWGGDTIFVGVSALQRMGIDDLLAAVLTVAEVLELKANPDRPAKGIVIEAHMDKGKGPIATMLIQKGTLNVGDIVVAGCAYGRVRAMVSDKGKRLKKAPPSTPLELHGLSLAPQAGDEFVVVKDDKLARSMAEKAAELRKLELQRPVQKVTLDDFFKQVQAGQTKALNLIIKGDVQGSVEALRPAVEKLSNQEVDVKVIHTGVGPVNESDIMLAKASNAIIIGFNVRVEVSARKSAEQEQVDLRFYRIIYEVLDDITAALKGMLAPVFKEVVLGQAEVRVVFRVTGSGVIAGCMVTEGKITRQAGARLLRGGIIIHESKIGSLKRFKDDAKEVATGYECGIGLDNYDDLKEGDIIEAYVREQVLPS